MTTKSLPSKPASKRGAPLGNKNAAGNAGNWYPRGNFITRHLISTLLADSDYSAPQRAKLVRKLTERLAARMADSADELLVIRILSNEAQGFLEQTKFYRQMLGSTTVRCSQDGATVAKGQEIARIYNDADAVVGSIIKKVGARPN